MPSRIEALKIALTGPESWEQKSRRIQLGKPKPSGPGVNTNMAQFSFCSGLINGVIRWKVKGRQRCGLGQSAQISSDLLKEFVDLIRQFLHVTVM